MKFKVMIPVDFTPVSAKAIELLAFLQDKTPLETHLVHVIQVNQAEWAGSNEASENIDHKALQKREQEAVEKFQNLKQHVDFSFTSQILYGGLTTELARYAESNQIDLVIMGTKGATGLLEKISGSEAQQLVRHAQIPVISIHEFASISPIQHILWVADFKEKQQQNPATNTVIKLQQLFGAKIHLLQILAESDKKKEANFKSNMERFAQAMQLQDSELYLKHDYKVPQGVRNFNQETEMDLVVIGTHDRNSFSKIFYGSVAETLINRCIRPLLTYHIK
ncbi:universal stress protein [Adhaeribacter sp. BT258]|uniref:Universal stress protein n=1 Tax=Adhaeribacter terrigena TaxID=2793070 RepID=A0ABS1BXI2_9BACT|nr:universal stress protein [Adhaeribacter terrigena]MBK0401839.1 universal stress protein [Adhaeribacter terrigena]